MAINQPRFWRRVNTEQAVSQFIAAKTARGLSEATMRNYRSRLERFARRFAVLPLAPSIVEDHLASIGGPFNRHGEFRVLRTFYRWLKAKKKIRWNPLEDVEAPVVPKTIARSLSVEELRRLLSADHRPVDRAFLFLLADTGLRIGEALSIREPEQFGSGMVVVRGKVGAREVPVSAYVKDAVLPFLPWPWATVDGAKGAVRRSFRRAGIEGPRASAHTLRHTFCRLWEGDESVLEGIMGWTSARMRLVYRPFDMKRAKEQHQQWSTRVAGYGR